MTDINNQNNYMIYFCSCHVIITQHDGTMQCILCSGVALIKVFGIFQTFLQSHNQKEEIYVCQAAKSVGEYNIA